MWTTFVAAVDLYSVMYVYIVTRRSSALHVRFCLMITLHIDASNTSGFCYLLVCPLCIALVSPLIEFTPLYKV